MTNLLFNRTTRTAGALLVAMAALPACGAEVDQPTQEDYDQVAEALAPLIVQDTDNGGTLATIATAARGESVGSLHASAGSAAALGVSLEWSIDVECRDTSGSVLTRCDERTDAAAIGADFSGSLEIGGYSASVSADGTWSLEGMLSGPIRVTGDQELVASSEFQWFNETQTFDLNLNKSYDLTFPTWSAKDAEGVLGGDVFAHRTRNNPRVDVDQRFDIDVAVDLPGDRTAILILDGDARYSIDLNTGRVTAL